MMLNDAFRKQQEKVVSFPSVRVILSGRLGRTIEVYGDWLPRQIFGQLTAFCAILRMISLAIAAAITNFCPDVIVLDGVSAPIPLLKVITNFGRSHHLPPGQIAGFPVLFYCHYPDKVTHLRDLLSLWQLLCVDRVSPLKRLYRLPLDLLEESTTASADCIVVNSSETHHPFSSSPSHCPSRVHRIGLQDCLHTSREEIQPEGSLSLHRHAPQQLREAPRDPVLSPGSFCDLCLSQSVTFWASSSSPDSR
jgi:hypothetical protein